MKKNKTYKARINFLRNHLMNFSPEAYRDYIESRMYGRGYSGAEPRFVMEMGAEVAQLNKVEKTADEYRRRCEKEYADARAELELELKKLNFYVALIDDGMDTLKRINEKYGIVVEGYYISNTSIEAIADSIHLSRTRCYELRREGISCMADIIYGRQ